MKHLSLKKKKKSPANTALLQTSNGRALNLNAIFRTKIQSCNSSTIASKHSKTGTTTSNRLC